MANITLNLIKASDYSGKLVLSFAVAPEAVTLDSAGKDAGDIRLNISTNKALVSLGKKEKVSAEMVRRAGGSIAKWLAKNNLEEAGVDLVSLEAGGLPINEAVFALAEGLYLGAFTFDKYKSGDKKKPSAVSLLVGAGQPAGEFESALQKAEIIAEATNLSREWAHEPPNVINPVTLAARVEKLAAEVGLKCTVLDDKQLEEMGAGAIHAVGKGSNNPSRLIILEHAGTAGGKPVALVGKALTMDTGGYSLKSSDSIIGMKYDKSGGMTVVATMLAVAKLGLKTPVVGVIAAAENMISGGAYRPDDILKSLIGKTIEIISTDAEGRLVLADALTYTGRTFEPRAMVDIATLTGAVVVALGSVRAGVMGADEVCNGLFAAGERVYERLWRLPLDEEYFDQIKGDDSDVKNSGGRKAGSIIGGTFLKQFVPEGIPWAHVDVAGVMDTEREQPYCPKGGMGFGVRLFVNYIESFE